MKLCDDEDEAVAGIIKRVCRACGVDISDEYFNAKRCRKCVDEKNFGTAYCQTCGEQFNKAQNAQKFCTRQCSMQRPGSELRIQSTKLKYLELNKRFFKMDLTKIKDCKNKCPLFEIFSQYMAEIAASGREDMLKHQAQQIKELRSRLHEIKDIREL